MELVKRPIVRDLLGPAAGSLLGLVGGLAIRPAFWTATALGLAGLAGGGLVVATFRALGTVRRDFGSWVPLGVFLVALGGLSAAAGSRLARPSRDTHFVYLAESLNRGTWAMLRPPPHGNDWARVLTLTLRDGRVLRGRWWRTEGPRVFRTLDGRFVDVPPGAVRRREATWYVSFPPMPAAVIMPAVAVWGHGFRDTVFTVLVAAFNALLVFLFLAEVRRRKLVELSRIQVLWLTAFFTFGTVNFFCSVQGKVWYTAHVLGITFLLGFLLASLDARWPLVAGACLTGAALSRTPMALAFPFFLLQAARPGLRGARLRDYFRGMQVRHVLGAGVLFGIPLLLGAAWMMGANVARFGRPLEFGHTYLAIRWAGRIERWGLFNVHYVPRNLAAALTLLPHFQSHWPYITISRHGLSLLLTTPLFVYALWPARRAALHWPCWLAIAGMAILHFTYQNSGYVQFSYRFSLDYTPFLVLLVADSGRSLGPVAWLLALWGGAWHTFGALSFDRWPQFYARSDWLFPVT